MDGRSRTLSARVRLMGLLVVLIVAGAIFVAPAHAIAIPSVTCDAVTPYNGSSQTFNVTFSADWPNTCTWVSVDGGSPVHSHPAAGSSQSVTVSGYGSHTVRVYTTYLSPNVDQSFTVVLNEPPTVTCSAVSPYVGASQTFNVNFNSTWPNTCTYVQVDGGTAVHSHPAAGSSQSVTVSGYGTHTVRVYTLLLSPNVDQSFTIVLNEPPTVTCSAVTPYVGFAQTFDLNFNSVWPNTCTFVSVDGGAETHTHPAAGSAQSVTVEGYGAHTVRVRAPYIEYDQSFGLTFEKPDPYEADDSVEQANALVPGAEPQQHTLEPAGDHDWVYVDVVPDMIYTFLTNPSTSHPEFNENTDTDITLYDSDGVTQLDYNDDYDGLWSGIEWTSTESKRIYLEVGELDDREGAYDLTVTMRSSDFVPPALSDNIVPYYDSVADFTIGSVDNTTGVSDLVWTLDGVTGSLTGGETSSLSKTFRVLGMGPHTLTYSSTDGNANSASKTVWFEIRDFTAPELIDDAVSSYNNTAVINLTPKDLGSGVDRIAYRIDGGEWVDVDGATAQVTVPTHGLHSLEWWAMDAVGNGATTKTLLFEIFDTISPSHSGGPDSAYDDQASFSIHGEDNDGGSGIASVSYAFGESEPTVVAGDNADVFVGAIGSYTITFWTTDNDGNRSRPETRSFTVTDTIGPEVDYDGALWFDAPSATLDFDVKDFPGGSGVDYVIYSIDWGVWRTISEPVSLDLVGLGTYTVRVWAIDHAGNWGTAWQKNVTLTDATAPGTSDDAVSHYDDSASIAMSATDSNTGVDFIRYRLDGGDWTTVYEGSASAATSKYGTHTLEYYAQDEYGNASSTVTREFFVDDTVAPKASDTIASPYSDTATFDLGGSDDNSGVHSVTYVIDSGSEVEVHGSSATVTLSSSGSYSITYWVTDEAGNPSRHITVTVLVNDTILPSVSADPDGGTFEANALVVTVTGGDNAGGSGMSRVGYAIAPAAVTWVDGTSTTFDLSGLGEHAVTVYAVDVAGNTASKEITYTLADTTAPGVTDDAVSSYAESASIKLTATDSNSGVASISYKLDDAGWTSVGDASAVVDTTVHGTHTLVYKALDNAGNESGETTVEFSVNDATAPAVGDDHVDSYDNTGAFTISADDPDTGVAGITYSINGAAGVTVDSTSVVISLPAPGDYEIVYTAADHAGNVSGATTVLVTVIDTVPPVTRIGGADRYAVAAALARQFRPTLVGYTDVIVACGEDRAAADPLGASGLASVWGAPVLLTQSARLTPVTASTIKAMRDANGGRINIHVIGGTGSVPAAVYSGLAALRGTGTIERIAGADRYAVAANMAARMVVELAKTGETVPGVVVLNIENPAAFLHGLAASPLSAHAHLPMVGVKGGSVPAPAAGVLAARFAGTPRYAVSGAYMTTAVRAATGCTETMSVSADRFVAATEIAQFGVAKGFVSLDKVMLANKLPDALTGGAVGGLGDGVLLYTDASPLASATGGFVAAHKTEIKSVWVLGGTASITDATIVEFENLFK